MTRLQPLSSGVLEATIQISYRRACFLVGGRGVLCASMWDVLRPAYVLIGYRAHLNGRMAWILDGLSGFLG